MSIIQPNVPLHIQVANIYKRRIATGDLPEGTKLPTVREMARLHEVAPGTAARAVELLASEKLVTTRGRAGTFVGGDVDAAAEVVGGRLVFGPQQRLGWTEPIPGEHTEVTAAGMIDAPAYVAARLSLEPVTRHQVTPVYRREQVTSDPGGEPFRLEVNWFHPRWVEVIPALASETVPIPSLGGVAWLIAQASGDPIVKGVHGEEARPVLDDGREMPFLGLGPGTVILAAVYEWKVRNPRDQIETVEYGEYIVPQGRVIEHEYDVAAEPADASLPA